MVRRMPWNTIVVVVNRGSQCPTFIADSPLSASIKDSADYLRAWITESMLRHYLEGVYGEDWFSHPEAGRFLRELWATGESKENEDIAQMIGRKPLDTTCLVRGFLDLE
jgi:hypothetical protein